MRFNPSRRTGTRTATLAAIAVAAGLLIAGPAQADTGTYYSNGSMTPTSTGTLGTGVGAKLTGAQMVARARDWVSHSVSYNQQQSFSDAEVGGPYRTDCGGLVDMAWQLPSSPPVTNPSPGIDASTYSTKLTSWSQLQPGDALAVAGAHINLFAGWTNQSTGAFTYIAEDNPGVPTGEYSANIHDSSIDGYATSSFELLRSNKLAPAAPPALTITGGIANGSSYNGTVTIAVTPNTVPDNNTVYLHIDGNTYTMSGSGTSYSYTLDTTALGNGPHAVYAGAYFSNAATYSPTDTITVGGTAGAALLASNAQQDYFGPGPDGHLHHWYWNNPTTGTVNQDWGGSLAGTAVSFVSTGGQQNVFGRGADGSLRHWWWNPSMASPSSETWPAAPGGALASAPTASFNPSNGQYDIYARIADGTLQHWWWAPGMTTPGTNNWGGSLTGTPVALWTGTQQVVFESNTSGSLQHWWWQSGMANPSSDTWASTVGTVTGDPAATFNPGAGQFDVYAPVSDGTLQHWWWAPGMTTPGTNNWGGSAVGRPTALWTGTQQVVFARNAAGSLQHYWWQSGMTSPATDTWGTATNVTNDPAATVRQADGQFDTYAGLSDGTLEHYWWKPGMTAIGTETWGGTLASIS